MNIDVCNGEMTLDGNILRFPSSLAELVAILGEPTKNEFTQLGETNIWYNYDDLGLAFKTCDPKCIYLKGRKAFIDEEHNVVSCFLYYSGRTTHAALVNAPLPSRACKVALTFEGRRPWFWTSGGSTRIGNFSATVWERFDNDEPLVDEGGFPTFPVSVSFSPERPKSGGSYKIKPCKEETLAFDSFNFKLAILQVLIYDLELLEPYFDIYEFAEQYAGKEIDTESDKPIRPIVNYFKKLPIPKSLAAKVEEVYMDGGNDVYMNIVPQWDGEDGLFDVDDVTERDIAQFPNLKKVTLMSSDYDKVSMAFKRFGVEVSEL